MSTHSIAYIKIDGELLASLPGATIDLGGKTRAPTVGASSILGFSETIAPAMIECDIAIKPGFSLTRLAKITDATITYESATGQTWIVRQAFCTETVKVSGGADGKATLRFAGQPAEEVV